MTQTSATQETLTTTPPDASAAVLYVCAERGPTGSGLAAERAREEGEAFAAARGLRLVDVIADPFGEADPLHREGWCRVRELAERGEAATVIARWPAVIAPDASHELRHREIRWLMDHGVTVRYSWAPLASQGQVK